MAETTFIFGAGINRGLRQRDRGTPHHALQAPLAIDFFRLVLSYRLARKPPYIARIQPLLDFIERYWGLSLDDLRTKSNDDLRARGFDLEACWSLLALQIRDTGARGPRQELERLLDVEWRLTGLLGDCLTRYLKWIDHDRGKEAFDALGRMIVACQGAVLTFNYDTLLEDSIEAASRRSGLAHPSLELGAISDPAAYLDRLRQASLSDDDLDYSKSKWRRVLAYGVEFDRIQIHGATTTAFVARDRFYGRPANRTYAVPFLKLHGSLNWFTETNLARFPLTTEDRAPWEGESIFLEWSSFHFNEPPIAGPYLLRPMIITPVVHKAFDDVAFGSFFTTLWDRARQELRSAERVVIGGYSFPPTDFHVRRLFLEAFADGPPREVILIDPDPEKRLVALVRHLCRYDREIRAFSSLEEFVVAESPELFYDRLVDSWSDGDES